MPVEVWWSTLAAADRGLLPLLDDVETQRVRSLERPADRGRSLLGAALLRVAVAGRLGVSPAEVVVDRTCEECGAPHGAPRVLGPGETVPWVSVSHSGLLVAVALDPGGPVGIDVQRESDLDDADGEEWVRREALLKLMTAVRRSQPAASGGAGQGEPLVAGDAAESEPAASEGAARGGPGASGRVPQEPSVLPLRAPREGYAAALATLRPADAPRYRWWPGLGPSPDSDAYAD